MRRQRVLFWIVASLLQPCIVDGFLPIHAPNGIARKSKKPTMAVASMVIGDDFLLSAAASVSATPVAALSPLILRSVELGAFPAIGMNLVTLLGLNIATPPKVVGALQHFSAGILLTTISKELLPEMVNAQGWQENLASGIGFFSGVGVLILLGILLPEEELETTTIAAVAETQSADTLSESESVAISAEGEAESESDKSKDKNKETTTSLDDTNNEESSDYWDEGATLFPTTRGSLRNRSMSRLSLSQALCTVGDTKCILDSERDTSVSMSSMVAALPTALLAAIAIDSALDGLLIGVSTAVDPDTTGPLLAASLTVESSFLGLTIAAALRGVSTTVPNLILLLAAALAPAAVLTGSIIGGGLAPTLAESPVLLAGVLGFGTSATLFMVAEELLLEAHEDGSDHVWWVDLQLYTGFFASVMIAKLVGM